MSLSMLVVRVRGEECRTGHRAVPCGLGRPGPSAPGFLSRAPTGGAGFAMFSMSLVIPQLLQLPEQTGYGLGRSLLT
ncbi:hypothetical protein ABZ678_37915, partial [Streptomyces hirsutus]|uniref:hypothetical protein n=1 Tax=Streptomyces hirsutus TaxID=35620 RepID=UPI0033D7F67C